MTAYTIPILIALLTVAPFWLAYGVARFRARRRLAAWLSRPRSIPPQRAADWQASGWLAQGWGIEALPDSLSLTTVVAEWAAVDPEILGDLQLSHAWRRLPDGALDALLNAAWEALPEPARQRTAPRLRAALRHQEGWWSGAEHGWTGRPFVLPDALAPRSRPESVRGLVVSDLTVAPLPGPFIAAAAEMAAEADLPLLYALQRRTPPRFIHPLASAHVPTSVGMTAGLIDVAQNAATRVGQQAGARLGAILGPLGSTVGQYLGSVAGQLARTVAQRETMPEPLRASLKEVEEALARLGEVAAGPAFAEAIREPERHVLKRGGEWEPIRARRARAWRSRCWPTLELALVEACMEQALTELHGLREVSAALPHAAARAEPLVRGGLLLQNPWLARRLPDGSARLSAARAALNAAARRLARGG